MPNPSPSLATEPMDTPTTRSAAEPRGPTASCAVAGARRADAGWRHAAQRHADIHRLGVAAVLALGLGLAMTPAWARTTTHVMQFSGAGPGQALPTGSFTFDSDTGRFKDFRVTYRGAEHDFTAAANHVGGHTPLPHALGHLGRNLIDGFSPLGLESAHWYATPDTFIGFQWRTPTTPAETFGLTPLGPDAHLDSRPGAVAGTWATREQPLPSSAPWWLLAAAVLGAAAALRPIVQRARAARLRSFDEYDELVAEHGDLVRYRPTSR